MSSGGSSFSHLKYLHAGLQESAQRQIDEFNERVQVHFDWLANFKVEKEVEKAVYVVETIILQYFASMGAR